MNSHDVAIVSMFGLALLALAILLRPLLRAWARRLEPGDTNAPMVADIADLDRRVAELEAAEMRVGELEERLDFTERLLAQRNAAELPPYRTPT